MRHEFLQAMEEHECVGVKFGWLPRHIGIYQAGKLVAAMPLYEKHNSYGEFVFDHAWADAYQRSGLNYYPKLVSSVPYTPASGQRLLCESGRESELQPMLLQAALQLAESSGASGFHCLFPAADEHQFMEKSGLITRHDCQYHWVNQNYDSFEDFLSRLNSRKRKSIRQQRRKVAESGAEIRLLNGHTATADDWSAFTRFYNETFISKWGMATFNQGFFMQVAEKMPDQLLLVLADLDGECIAGSLMYLSDECLYGRHWGCIREVDQLHFEACYYQGIEFAIRQGLKRFEPGAQGEHKIARGFLPVQTRSSHWICDPRFQRPISAFCGEERVAVDDYIEQQQQKSPYRKADI